MDHTSSGICTILQNGISEEYHYLEISIWTAKTKGKFIMFCEMSIYHGEISKRKFHTTFFDFVMQHLTNHEPPYNTCEN